MLILARALGHAFPSERRQWVFIAVLGLLNNTLYLGLSFFGLKTVSAGLVTVIVSANPLMTALFAHWILGESLSPSKMLGLTLGLGGVAFIMRHRIHLGTDGALGIFLAALGAFAFALGTVLFKRARLGLSLLSINALQAMVGGVGLLPAAFWLEDLGAVRFDMRLGLSLAYLVLVISVAAVLVWLRLVKSTTASNASALHFLNPALGVFFGWLFLGESVFPLDFVGVLPIAAGILLVTRAA